MGSPAWLHSTHTGNTFHSCVEGGGLPRPPSSFTCLAALPAVGLGFAAAFLLAYLVLFPWFSSRVAMRWKCVPAKALSLAPWYFLTWFHRLLHPVAVTLQLG